MVLAAQPTTAAEVELATLVHPEQTVDTSLYQCREHEIRGKIAVAQHDLARLETLQQGAKEGRLARLLPFVRTHRQVANHPGRQRDDRHQPGYRKSHPSLLGIRLGERLLIF